MPATRGLGHAHDGEGHWVFEVVREGYERLSLRGSKSLEALSECIDWCFRR